MLGFTLLNAERPPHKKPVHEVRVKNWLALPFRRRSIAAMTLPCFGFAVILYFLAPDEEIAPQIRVHEWVHIEQWERPGPFYVQYFRSVVEGHGYMGAELEKEAYAAQALSRSDMPAWARSHLD